ncbi:MAG: hypothetical protein ACRDVG_00650 [Jatrophihabitantaceae bacterium]
MRCRRALTALTLAVLAVAGLSACQTKIGQAAAVDSHTLSDTDLTGYLKPGTVPYSDPTSRKRVIPKLFVLENWIRVQLLRAAIAHKGGEVTTSELNTVRAALLGDTGLAPPEATYAKLGYTNKLGDLAVEQSSLVVLLVQRLAGGISVAQALQILQRQNQQASAALIRAIGDAHAKVEISPRYGAWDAKALTVSADPGAGAPPFVDFGSGAATLTP